MISLLVSIAAAPAAVAPAERAAIFRGAGFTRRGADWTSGQCAGTESESYAPGKIDFRRDLNGDGRPEALVTEGGAACYGNVGMHFWLLSRQPNGTWKVIADASAMPQFLRTKGPGGWPDIELGGPGFCFPVWRWNGRAYRPHRFEYDGRPCRK
jgi:hypothetical protein